MLSKLCLLAVVIPFISALTLNGPTEPVTTSGPITLTWTSESTDVPTFSLEMVNEHFHDTFAIANNVDINAGTITLTLPSIPPNREYTIEAVDISNITNVFATTPPFNVGPAVSSSQASSSQSRSSTSPSGSGSSMNGSSMSTPTPMGSSSMSFGVTMSSTGTSSTSTNSTGTASGANAPTGSNFGNSDLSVRLNANKGFMASVVLTLIAGAAIVAL